MYLGVALILCSLVYSILISVVYYSKKRANIQELLTKNVFGIRKKL